MPPTSSTSTPWRWSSPSARRPSIRASPSSPGRRARRHARRRGRSRPATRSPTSSPRSRPGCARPSPGWASARSPATSAGRSSTPSTSRRTSSRAASRWPRRGPAGRPWPTSADRQLRRREAALALPPTPAGREPRLPDPGFARFRADGEAHLFSPAIAKEIQVLSGSLPGDDATRRGRASTPPWPAIARRWPDRSTRRRCPRDELRIRRLRDGLELDAVEDARAIARRFVVSAMSVGALSPGGPPGADHRHPARRRLGQHRRGRRGPGVVRARTPTAAAATPGSSRSPRRASA